MRKVLPFGMLFPAAVLWIMFVLSSCPPSDAARPPSIGQAELRALLEACPEGGTVKLPEEVCRIDREILVEKALRLEGAGGSKTIIESSLRDYDSQPLAFRRDADSEGYPLIRVTGISFRSEPEGNHSNFLSVKGPFSLRVDHCDFSGGGAHSLMVDGDIHGVIDHCSFTDDSEESVSVRNSAGQEAVWSAAPSLPARYEDALFIEDCSFAFREKGTHAVTAINGARFVFRRNLVESSLTGALVDAHGNFEDGRSTYSAEVYDNELVNSGGNIYIAYAVYIRGGKAVICDNALNGNFSFPITLTNYRSWTSSARHSSSGTFLDPDDGKAYEPNLATYEDAMALSDLVRQAYCWGNTLIGRKSLPSGSTTVAVDGLEGITVLLRGHDNEHIQAGREYFEEDPGYVKRPYPHPLAVD